MNAPALWISLAELARAGSIDSRLVVQASIASYGIGEGLRRTPMVFEQSISWFGYFEVHDVIAIVIWAVVWAGVIVIALAVGDWRDRGLLLGVVTFAVALPIAVSLYHPPPIYISWQGRHSLPLWSGIPILAGTIAAGSERARVRLAPVVAVGFAAVLALAGFAWSVAQESMSNPRTGLGPAVPVEPTAGV